MIPDFRNILPYGLDRNDPVFLALVAKANKHIAEWVQDIIDLNKSYRADEARSEVIDLLADMLNAAVKAGDVERTKRIKTAGAVRMHKQRSLWSSIKVIVDSIMNGDATILTAESVADWIFYGADGMDNEDYVWGIWATDGIDPEWGIDVFGTFTEMVFKGNIYINCDNKDATYDDVEKLKKELVELVPCYVKIYLGYIDSGVFNQYSNGVMG